MMAGRPSPRPNYYSTQINQADGLQRSGGLSKSPDRRVPGFRSPLRESIR
jgi:hypothetical protein